ncbi:hypothetical protein [Citrobacter freundii]|uniref:tail fiber/spike domain-containing protein n=1 Tax=Citrobacter freundii TaxID=546 RepID=UPI001FFE214D|nr:hypothetical protein [Citrobacter freundii]
MATQPTNLQVPSESPRDLKFNAGKIDEYVTSMGWTYTDRFGQKHYTIEGNNYLAQQAMASFGYVVLTGKTFTTGATISQPNEVLLNTADGEYYKWTGSFVSGPKVVPANSTPAGTGGIGPGAWLSIGDAALRSQLALPGGAELVGTENSGTVQDSLDTLGLANDLTSLNEMMESKNALLIDGFTVADAFSIPSFTKLSGIGFRIGFIGSSTLIDKAIKKTTNSTITLSNQDPNAGSQTVDCIAYVEPAWPSLSVYPQKTTIEDISFCGAAPSITQAGLFILQGAGWSLNRIDAVNVINGLWCKDVWTSEIGLFHTMGKIRVDGGTSLTLSNCWAKGHTSRPGAFDFSSVKYTSLINCASDNAVNTAYHFEYCQGLLLDGCGCEFATTLTADNGSALTFTTGNNAVVNGFTCVPVSGQQQALIAVGDNNNVEFNGFDSSFGIPYVRDIYIYGNGSKIAFKSSRFAGNALPSVEFKQGSTSKVFVTVDGNEYAYSAPASGGVSSPEVKYIRNTWTPELKIGGTSTGITHSSLIGNYVKNGNTVTASFSIALSNKGSETGIVTIAGLTCSPLISTPRC